MLARLNAPVIGAQEIPYAGGERWRASFSWRYQKSDRHFRGSHEETNRQAEHSEVINTINLLDFSLDYTIDPRWTLAVSFPYLMAERSSPIRDENRVTIGRSLSQARGLGDVIVGARRWMLDPAAHPTANLQLGFGLKLPTGADNVIDTRTRYEAGEYVDTLQTVDQSVQPGDGGFGAVFDLQWFKRFAQDRCALYTSLTYLFNPEGSSGVRTYRSRPGEEVMSIADQYLVRAGASFALGGWRGASASIGGRVEGVPVYDVFGGSDGFRRPGYAVSVEPGFNLARGRNEFTVSLPIALYRNRTRSVPDRMNGTHGDAAFADWLLIVGYARRFGGASPQVSSRPTCSTGPTGR